MLCKSNGLFLLGHFVIAAGDSVCVFVRCGGRPCKSVVECYLITANENEFTRPDLTRTPDYCYGFFILTPLNVRICAALHYRPNVF